MISPIFRQTERKKFFVHKPGIKYPSIPADRCVGSHLGEGREDAPSTTLPVVGGNVNISISYRSGIAVDGLKSIFASGRRGQFFL